MSANVQPITNNHGAQLLSGQSEVICTTTIHHCVHQGLLPNQQQGITVYLQAAHVLKRRLTNLIITHYLNSSDLST